MRELKDRVAVITGAASGIGRGIAERCGRESMKVVLADLEEEALARTAQDMKAKGVDVLAVPTDVSKEGDIKALAEKTLNYFGAVHLLFNNAGVNVRTSLLESTLADWQWLIGVNLWGVIHGVRIFAPIMLAQDTDCHIVNTASGAGLISSSQGGIYKVTKHGVVSLSETLYHELKEMKAKVKVSVLVPVLVKTRFSDAERNRPKEFQNDSVKERLSPESLKKLKSWEQMGRQATKKYGLQPEKSADYVFNAIKKEKFYILTHFWIKPAIQMRMEDILLERNPTNVLSSKLKTVWVMVKNILPIPRPRFIFNRGARGA